MGANKRHDKLTVQGLNRVMVHGSFRPNGATGIVSGSTKGKGYSVARSGTGLYTITFDDKYPALVSAVGHARAADATPTVVQFGDYSAANKTLQLRLLQASTGALTKPKGTIPLDISVLREIVSSDIANLTDTESTAGRTSGGLLALDSDPLIRRVNYATDKALRVVWAAANVTEVQFPPVVKPVDLDDSEDVEVHLMIAKGSNTDTSAVIDVQVFDGVGDTEMGGNTDALATDALTEYVVTLANADIGAQPGFFNISLIPGAHANDAEYLYAAWIEYTRKTWATTGQVFAVADMTADADAEINFECIFRNTSVDY